jgi:hypothetical protein
MELIRGQSLANAILKTSVGVASLSVVRNLREIKEAQLTFLTIASCDRPFNELA